MTQTRKWIDLWENYWFGPVAAIRPYLLMKAVLLLLAFDMWLLRITKGARYGVFEFNIAHFPWLDAIQPLPTPALFVGSVLSVGLLAMVCTLGGAFHWALVLLALSYTYTWSMSLLDSFQHHYFISLVLFAFVFFPLPHATELYQPRPPTEGEPPLANENAKQPRKSVSSWGYRLLGVNVAIVYLYTGITKMSESEFLQGEILRRMTRENPFLRLLAMWFADFNIGPELFYQLAAWGVIAVQTFLAFAYVLTVSLDESRSRWLHVVAWFGFIGAVSFHGIGNELVLVAHLRIGWFSYYMIAFACVFFLPAPVLWLVGGLMTWPVRFLVKQLPKILATFAGKRVLDVGLAIVGLALAVGSLFIGFHLDLPGGEAVGLLAAIGGASPTLAGFFVSRQLEEMTVSRFESSLVAERGSRWSRHKTDFD